MMLGEDSTAGRYWEEVGKEALKRGVKGVVFMGAHWEVGGAGVEIASNPGKDAVVKQPVAWVTPDKYVDYEVSLALWAVIRSTDEWKDPPSPLRLRCADQLVSRAGGTGPRSSYRCRYRG